MKKTIKTLVVAMAAATTAMAQNATFSHYSYAGNDQRFQQQYDPQKQYLNPILAGFYPDPSICRAGDTYYLVNSSFSFFPGVPIFQSNDLVNWQQLGHVLDRPSQVPLKGQRVSGGIFAPDIKYNARNKTFYMITTNVGAGNFFVKTTDPAKGWSEPVYLPQVDGIDPSFFFDRDGSAYIVHNGPVEGGADYEGQRAIRILRFDTRGDSIITRGTPQQRGWWQIVRGGTHVEERPIWIEGPHLYRIGKYYYLMCAEGGTGDWHSEVIFRAPVKADITDPAAWEECPHNPILTQRTGLDPKRPDIVTSTGHADLVQTPAGDWYAVFLGCRAYEGPFYNTGRDTYMLPVTWRDGWPTILEPGKPVPTVVNLQERSKKQEARGKSNHTSQFSPLTSHLTGNFTYTDDFNTAKLDQRWMFLRNPTNDFYTTGNGQLTIRPLPCHIGQREALSAIFCRQQHTNFEAETTVDFHARTASELAGMALLQNEDYNFVLGKTVLDGRPAIVLTRAERGKVVIASAFLTDADAPVRLKVSGNGRYYTFCYATADGQWQTLATGVDAVNLSTSRSGGFIGACIGLYATTENQ
ncbi:MAG: glycoside hydrolase family 43 protein [Prevotella sp.]|nr:glycoside hydrolase family 43 protein [Prevotella sp.]